MQFLKSDKELGPNLMAQYQSTVRLSVPRLAVNTYRRERCKTRKTYPSTRQQENPTSRYRKEQENTSRNLKSYS